MITFTSISYKNFLSTGNIPIVIQLDKSPVTVITGANGTGKSTGVIDAIFFALYGKPYRKLKKDQLLNTINMKNLEVELSFNIGSSEYKISRGIKPNKFDIFVDGILKPQPAAIKDYQIWLEDSVLKMNAVTMRQIVFLGSTSYIPFMRLCPNDRRKVVEEILDIQVFSIMNSLLKGRAGVYGKKYEEIQNRLKLLANNINLKQKHLSEINSEKQVRISENKEKMLDMRNSINQILGDIDVSMKLVETLLSQIDDAGKVRNNKSELNVLISNMTKNRNRSQRELDFFVENYDCPTCGQYIEEDLKTKSIDLNKRKVDSVVEALSLAQSKLDEYESRLNEISEIESTVHHEELKISNNQTRISSVQEHIESVRVEIEKLCETSETRTSNKVLLDEIISHEEESSEIRTERDEIANTTQYYQVVSSLLKDGGIKSQIINNYLPTINSLIRKYLEILEFPCEFTFDEEFNETMKSRFRDKFSYANFSEGQKMRIDLSLLFSWRELARLRNSATCNLLVLDEVGSSSLDAEGTDAFMRIVGETSESNNVFIISHDTSVTETDMFSRCIEYSIEDNFSVMKESA